MLEKDSDDYPEHVEELKSILSSVKRNNKKIQNLESKVTNV